MKVDGFHIREITFGQERELYGIYKKAYRNISIIKNGDFNTTDLDWDTHDLALGKALEFAIENPDQELKGMTHPEIDSLAQQILIYYLRLGDDSKKK